MSDKPDISHIKLTSRVFPTDADMVTWNALSSEEQAAVIWRDIDDGLESPTVEIDKNDLMRRALERVLPAAE